jgi:pimeloyl-ACP methyl ester carboxylesterase
MDQGQTTDFRCKDSLVMNVICVHGRNANAVSWNDVDQALGATSVTLPDHDQPLPLKKILWLSICGKQDEALALLNRQDGTATMQDWVAHVADKFPPKGKVSLIGHSMGGAVISHVAAAYPDRIERLIYVAAMLPGAGQSIRDIEALIADEEISLLAFLLDFAAVGSDARRALVRQPTGPLGAAFPGGADFTAIPRFHIECSGDDVIPNKVQKMLRQAYGDVDPTTMRTGHLPQYEAKTRLIAILRDMLAT